MAHLLAGTKLNACNYLRKSFERDPQVAKQHVHAICDELLNPKDLRTERTREVEWLKTLFACYSNGDFEEFSKKLRSVDSSPLCGCVWTANFVAYRCRTCATSPCMSLCAACFESGNHRGHDYNIFRSEAGGACDCGDSSVMQKTGFCSHHGPNRVLPNPLPASYLNVAKVVMDRMVLFLLHVLRNLSANVLSPETFQIAFPPQLKELFAFLLELIKLGSVIRSHLCDLLLDESLYLGLLNGRGYRSIEDASNPLCQVHHASLANFKNSVQTLKEPFIQEEMPQKRLFKAELEYKRYLDELAYWTMRYEFPEPLILILLNLLPDLKLKQEFARSFTRHYSRIAVSLCNSVDVNQLSNRVVHISVQLFSNDEIALMLTNEEQLLQMFLISAHNIVSNMLAPSQTSEQDFHQCVMSQSREVQNNAYWPIFSDFINVLSHKKCVLKFLGDPDLVNCWVVLMQSFCGMDLVHRERFRHVEYESNQSLSGFYTEREACASPLWCFLDVLQDSSTAHLGLSMAYSVLHNGLVDLFDALGFESKLPYDQLSFHYPLHRYLALLFSHVLLHQGASLEDVLINEERALKIIQHPLHILVSMYEIQCGMWVRNGFSLSTQSLAYKQYFFCTFFIDADISLLQFSSLILSPDVLISSIFERCRITNCLTINEDVDDSLAPPGAPDADRRPKMLEAAFQLLATVIAIRTNTGLKTEEIMEAEAVVLLTSQDCTYSMLQDHIPQCHESHSGTKTQNNTKILTECLEKLAVKKEGDVMGQTTYVPTDKCWQLYDPIMSHHRVLYRRHEQQAHKNYCSHLIKTGKLPPTTSVTQLWPPYKDITVPQGAHGGLVRLLHCPTLHAFIYIIIYKALHDHHVVTETTLSLCLHLLEASLKVPPPREDRPQQSQKRVDPSLQNILFRSWFDSSDMKDNITKVIDQVEAPTTSDQNPSFTRLAMGESILSLLLKLFDKFSKAPGVFKLDSHECAPHEQLPPTRDNVIRRVLNVAASKSSNIKTNIAVIYKTMHPHPTTSLATSAETEGMSDERRRRRMEAKKAQMRMMKQIQMQQKQFIDNRQMDFDEEDVVMTDLTGIKTYECCICGSSEVPAQAGESVPNTFGLICVVQPSFVLGHKKSDSHRPKLQPVSTWKEPSNFASFCKSKEGLIRYQVLQRNPGFPMFDEECLAPVGGVHVTTCGHHVHIACHAGYMESIHREQIPYLMLDGRLFFKCPMCRQLSNLVLRCPTNAQSQGRYPPAFSVAEKYKDLQLKCKDMLYGPVLDNVYIAFLSVFEHALLQLGGSLLSPAAQDVSKSVLKVSVERKIPIGALCYMLVREVSQGSLIAFNCWMEILVKGTGEVIVPVLYLDPSTLFTTMVVDFLATDDTYKDTGRPEWSLEAFQSLVQNFYNMVFTQALVQLSCKFSSQERSAWKMSGSSGIAFAGDNLHCLMSHVIRSLSPRLLYEGEKNVPTQPFNTVFTDASVFTRIEEYLLPFMRIASLVQQHLFKSGSEFPIARGCRSEFSELAVYLGLSVPPSSGDVNVLHCLKWKSDPRQLIQSWCKHIIQSGHGGYASIYKSLTTTVKWFSPKLLDLPEEYSTLFLMFRQQKCPKCDKVPRDPAICLVCGEYVCYKEPCQPDEENPYAACRHAKRCGAGTGIFLLVNTCSVVIVRGHRFCVWGTLYLDAHGEVDRDWGRGKPLYLKRDRLAVLERQWINHSFDNAGKNWGLHQDKL